jgi:hypothetical protein
VREGVSAAVRFNENGLGDDDAVDEDATAEARLRFDNMRGDMRPEVVRRKEVNGQGQLDVESHRQGLLRSTPW